MIEILDFIVRKKSILSVVGIAQSVKLHNEENWE